MNIIETKTHLGGHAGKSGHPSGKSDKDNIKSCSPGRRCLECDLHFCRQDRYKVVPEDFEAHGVFFKFIRPLDRKETD